MTYNIETTKAEHFTRSASRTSLRNNQMPVNLSDRKLFFICPVFYTNADDIVAELRKRGAAVDFFSETPTGSKYRLMKHSPKMRERYLAAYYEWLMDGVKAGGYDTLFVVKGAVIPPEIFREIRETLPKLKMIAYNWDSFANADISPWMQYFDKVFSFDPRDCRERKGLIYLPMFYTPEYETPAGSEPDIDLFFVGSIHGDRYALIRSLQQKALDAGRKFYPYLYISFLGWLRKKLTDKAFRPARMGEFRFRTLSKTEVVRYLGRSRAILDIHSGAQEGITPRVIEALAAGKKVVTTNGAIRQEKLYDPRFVSVVDRQKMDIDWKFVTGEAGKVTRPDAMPEYSIERWIDAIFSEGA